MTQENRDICRDIVVGDVHGCLEELDELLRTVEYATTDRLFFAGDLVDRGPDSVGVVRRVRELGALSVMGNHDEWYATRARGSTNKKRGKVSEEGAKKYALIEQFSDDDLAWMAKMPLCHFLDPRTVIVHAGLRPGVEIWDQGRNTYLRMRYLRRATGAMWDHDSDELLTPDVAAYWTEVWDGPWDVIYGHHPSKSDVAAQARPSPDGTYTVYTWGIDTGCCFGNKLTAWIRRQGDDEVELVSVPARKQYAPWHRSMGEG